MSVSTQVERIELAKQNLSSYLKQQGIADGTEKIDVLIGKAIDAMATYGERLDALEAKTMYDAVLSDTSVLAPQTKAVKAYVDENSGGSAAFASMFEIALSDTYRVETDADAPIVISNALNLPGFAVAIGTSGIKWKEPTVIIPTLDWSTTVDDNYDFTATGTVKIQFGEAGSISKQITFKKPGEGKLYAVRGENGAYIDTGILGNYAYTYHTKGHVRSTNQGVLMDAFVSTSERATVRVLGSSNKLQSMWYANKEITNAMSGIDVRKMFEMTAGANKMVLEQDGRTYEAAISGQQTSGVVNTNIRLLNSATSGYANNCIECFGEVLDENNQSIGYFVPYRIQESEIVMINTLGLTAQQIYDMVQNGDAADPGGRIFRPPVGYLVEVTQAEDEAL